MLMGGGLGNQMFQYALGRHLTIKNNQILKIDYSRYSPVRQGENTDGRNFGLNHFNINITPADQKDIKKHYKYYRYDTWINRFLSRINKVKFYKKAYYEIPFVVEPANNCQIFDPNILNYKYTDSYFRGFWQSEKYFKDIRDILLKDFTVKTAPDESNSALLQEIDEKTSVSLHIRRGDITYTESTVGTLPFDYYTEAIAHLTGKIKNPHFYIFSDDMDWVKKNFKIDFPTVYVQNSVEKDYEDMRLMSHCKHHIIANSTFSWWGAWLATYPEKIVIAPERYSQKTDRPNPDYYPESWVLIKSKRKIQST